MNLLKLSDSDLAVIGETWVNDHTKNSGDNVAQWLEKTMLNNGYKSDELALYIKAMKDVISWNYDGTDEERSTVCECVGGTFGETTGTTFACDWCASFVRNVRHSLAGN